VGTEEQFGDLTLVLHDFGSADRDIMAGWIDTQKARTGAIVAVALGKADGKGVFIASASSDAVSSLKVDIGSLAKSLLPQFGGRGGGKPAFAQGSIADDTDSAQVFAAVRAGLAAVTQKK
jgi:alanyl-tRNA synthetase